jgi:TolA-binding protein
MKCHSIIFFFALLALAAALPPDAVSGRAIKLQEEQAAAQDPEPEGYEDEYNAYDTAQKEPNLDKRGAMLIEFIEKYPKSKLMPHIDAAYTNLLFECSQEKKYEQLELLAEQWLKLHPNDLQTIAYIFDAAEKLGHDEKCVDCLEEIYKMQPSGSMAYNIAQLHKKTENQEKYIEWIEKMFTYPEYEGDYTLRYDLMQKYAEDKNLPKAAEYAELTLKSANLAKSDDAATKGYLRKVRHNCYHLIGLIQFEADNFSGAIKSFQQALRAEKYGDGYFWIGMSLWKQEKYEDAMIFFAETELQGGAYASQAKENLESLYKAFHNNKTTGINKIYTKAKEKFAGQH